MKSYGRKETNLLLAEKILSLAENGYPPSVSRLRKMCSWNSGSWDLPLKYELGRTGEYGRDQLEKSIGIMPSENSICASAKEASFFSCI